MNRKLFVWTGWAALALASTYFASQALPYLWAPVGELRLHPNPPGEETALRLHAGGGLIALILGPMQFLGILRRKFPLTHRMIGYGYIVGVAAGVAGALVLARTPQGDGANGFAFNMLAVIWATSTTMALVNARAKRWRQHQVWMIRSFALTFAAVTLRAGMPLLAWLGIAPSEFYTIVAWASWTINLIFAEWVVLPRLAAPEILSDPATGVSGVHGSLKAKSAPS